MNRVGTSESESKKRGRERWCKVGQRALRGCRRDEELIEGLPGAKRDSKGSPNRRRLLEIFCQKKKKGKSILHYLKSS